MLCKLPISVNLDAVNADEPSTIVGAGILSPGPRRSPGDHDWIEQTFTPRIDWITFLKSRLIAQRTANGRQRY